MDIEKIPPLKEIDNKDSVLPMAEVAKRTSKEKADYFPTGLTDFDGIIKGGVSEGDLIIIAGKTGEGKTSLAQSLTHNFNKIAVPCLWLSYEVSVKHLWDKFKTMGCDENLMAYTPLKHSSTRINWVKDKIREGVLKYHTKIVLIDHLGFLLPDADKYDNSMNQNYSSYLGNICRQLKTLAIEEDVIIILMAHVRKTSAELEIEDLANSAGIGQESDLVFMVERIRSKKKFGTPGDYFTDETMIKLVKNRRTGQTKIIKVKMVKEKFVPVTNIHDDVTFD